MSTRPALQAPTFIYKCKFKPSPIPPPSHICTASPLTAQDLFGFFPFEEKPSEWVPRSPESQGVSNRQHRMTATKRSNHQNFVKAVHKSYETCIFFLSYSNDMSEQMSPHQPPEGNDKPHQILWMTMLSVYTHTTHTHSDLGLDLDCEERHIILTKPSQLFSHLFFFLKNGARILLKLNSAL